jgi:hypothetical protein
MPAEQEWEYGCGLFNKTTNELIEVRYGIYISYDDAWDCCYEYNKSLAEIVSAGVKIRSAAEVDAALEELEKARDTEYRVVRRPIMPWEVALAY